MMVESEAEDEGQEQATPLPPHVEAYRHRSSLCPPAGEEEEASEEDGEGGGVLAKISSRRCAE
jgi:hypothetical protein